MYYKEEWINGKLFWKSSPNGVWIEFTKQQYAERLLKAESELKNLQLGAVMPSFPLKHKSMIEVNQQPLRKTIVSGRFIGVYYDSSRRVN